MRKDKKTKNQKFQDGKNKETMENERTSLEEKHLLQLIAWLLTQAYDFELHVTVSCLDPHISQHFLCL